MSTWGWLIEYGIVALIGLAVAGGLFALWGQDRLWAWQDHRDAKRERRGKERTRHEGNDD